MKRIATVLVALAVMLTPVSALAQSSTCQAYNPQLCTVSGGSEGPVSGETSTGTLPFTGLDVGLLAIGGGVLLVAGVIVRTRLQRLG
jgi:hypothetical protein